MPGRGRQPDVPEPLDAWAKDGRVFDHAYAPSPWTLPSFASIYTGHWPLIHQGGRTVRSDTGQGGLRIHTHVALSARIRRQTAAHAGAG